MRSTFTTGISIAADLSGEHRPVEPGPGVGGGGERVSSPNIPRNGAGVEDPERQRIIEALEECAGNQTYAARMLGISRRTLINRLEKYDVPRPRKRLK
jgi:DNA-binding NtrC family response regulator